MKLSKFPLVIHEEIFSTMTLSDLLCLSFLSKDIKQSIKVSQMKRFESIHSIYYDCVYEERILVDFSTKKGGKERLMTITEETTEDNYHKFNVSGRMIYFQFDDRFGSPLRAIVYPWDRECIISCVHNHFLDLFGNSVDYQWLSFGYKTPIPQLQNLSACIKLQIAPRLWIGNMNFLETLAKFLSTISVLKFVDLVICSKREVFSPESIFYQAESIKCYRRYTSPDVLRHFQGRQAVLSCGECEISDLIKFVNRWKSGEAFQKLEYLKIEIFNEKVPKKQVLDEIGAKYTYATRKHTLPKVYVNDYDEPNTDPITSHNYVVRQSDNRVASVLIEEKTFSFGVWDKTEQEFLGMVEYTENYTEN
ncbi:unnamed protein product [Caenorhabditis nigoni]